MNKDAEYVSGQGQGADQAINDPKCDHVWVEDDDCTTHCDKCNIPQRDVVYPLSTHLEDVLFKERRRLNMLSDMGEAGRICWMMIEAVGEYEHGSADLHVGNGSIQLADYAAVVEDLILVILNQS